MFNMNERGAINLLAVITFQGKLHGTERVNEYDFGTYFTIKKILKKKGCVSMVSTKHSYTHTYTHMLTEKNVTNIVKK